MTALFGYNLRTRQSNGLYSQAEVKYSRLQAAFFPLPDESGGVPERSLYEYL